ncbi:TlyA family RNA methyltransferase [Metamycoplasma alkalescens]|uniref:23S rRNA (Cytidine1920-2'-O)/16S rRNA (Cytidine1409-2'-O)-methyltransferase n=1 Tax=Metamycoplasma alkalescens TaxID=45363 RepID=A0A318UJU7_9BACT|nr:TlyA family RNA methyltransferase [Metamycoplasma alkalescens]PYF43703.1 23S rRNA (cytidine1920-2'-O)/16S rRNA (cytidine1409-2'-O)-methyltransferase [Metamycoplasma alkalescens]SYV90659.1 predicted 23S rRNA methylase [Metamycoplasma alkalescens]
MKKTLKELIKQKYNLDDKEINSLTMQGRVFVNNEKVLLTSLKFLDSDKIEIKFKKTKYVSRGAYKLKEAIEKFKLKIKNKVCLDIGSSTGGFVQILLENHAKKVYALDSGTNQLDFSLRVNENVVVYEKTNLKNMNPSMFVEKLDLVTCDVSFISLRHVFEICNKIFDYKIKLITLIKPQFEASSKYVANGGYVEQKYHEFILNKVINIAKKNNFHLLKAIIKSPILGEKSKNIEYLAFFEKQGD